MSSQTAAEQVGAVRVPLGQLLVKAEFIDQSQLEEALHEGSRTGERLGEIVVRRGFATEDDVARLLAEQWGLEYVERSSIWFDPGALSRLSREDAQRLEALPTRVEDGVVVCAVAEPTEQRLASLREVIGMETVVIVVPKSALDAGLRSELLRSRGSAQTPDAEAEPEPTPAAVPDPPPSPEHQEEPDLMSADESQLDSPVQLAAVKPLPFRPYNAEDDEATEAHVQAEPNSLSVPAAADAAAVDPEANPDAVLALANEARAVADRLAAQAAAVQKQQAEQNELRAQAEAYEARIAELERQLEERQSQADRMRGQLSGLLDTLGE